MNEKLKQLSIKSLETHIRTSNWLVALALGVTTLGGSGVGPGEFPQEMRIGGTPTANRVVAPRPNDPVRA